MEFLRYKGRFAPSPTGPLHFGSLVTAVGSYLEARSNNGEWWVRIEDVDEPRCDRQNEIRILRALDNFGFQIDGIPPRQSERKNAYQKALNTLFHEVHVYGCACTRKEIGHQSLAIDGAPKYSGTCRHGLVEGKEARAWRITVPDTPISFDDAIQGWQTQNLAQDVGDFVLLRADGYFAYQLAVVVDDADQEITHVVRGADLLDSTVRQLFLQQYLGVPSPQYMHLPIVLNETGEKLSKQTLAQAIDELDPVNTLFHALRFLGQDPPDALIKADLHGFWEWATAHWTPMSIPRTHGFTPPNS